MKSKLYRIISFTMTLVFILAISTTAFAMDTTVVDGTTAYNWAIDAGFPRDFLDAIDEDFLLKIYYENVDVPNLEITYDVSYYSEDGTPLTRGNISEDTLSFWIIGGKVSSNGIIQYVNTYVFYDWASNLMDWKLTDAIVVNWNSSLWYLGDNSFSATFSGETSGDYGSISRPATAEQGGLGWFVPLTGNHGAPYGEAAFKLYPTNTNLANGTANATSLTSIYAHRTAALSGLSFSTSGVSVSISGSYDQAADTCTIYYGV